MIRESLPRLIVDASFRVRFLQRFDVYRLTPAPNGSGSSANERQLNRGAAAYRCLEPLGNWRRVSVRERKTKLDWAEEISQLLDVDFPDADVVVLVMDNLNTHKIGSLYEKFPPDEARAYAKRLEIHDTPKHGSWLDAAEIELSILTKQCLNRRIGDIATYRREVQVWQDARNTSEKGADWQFTAKDARIKLKRLYPQF